MKHISCPAAAPQSGAKPFIVDIIHKAVERLGKKRVWRVAAYLESLPSPAPASAVRETLRDLAVFLSDEDYAAMVQTYTVVDSTRNHSDSAARNNNDENTQSSSNNTAPSINTAALLEDLCTLSLTPRRQYVLDLVIRKLDPKNTGLISYADLSDQYDVLRHPEVCNGARSEDDVLTDFFDSFEQEDGSYMEQLTTSELRLYAVGLSTNMADDTEFELWCTRAFCLDRPRLKSGEETVRVVGSRLHSRQSRLLGEGRQHPLYSTSNETYGKDATPADYKMPTRGRPQKFTKNVVVRTGGATTMNM